MNNAVKDGGEKLNGFAEVSGLSAEEFSKTWEKDPYKALQLFETGLNKQNKSGQNVNDTLKSLGITELRERDTVLRLANGNKQLADARKNADKGFEEGIALNKEAETKYKTLGNQMKIFMNNVRDLGISIGGALAPMITFIMKGLTPMIQWLSKAPAPIRAVVGILAVLAAAIGPVLVGLGALAASIGSIAGSSAIMGILGGIGTALGALVGPVGIVIGIIAALGAALVIAYKKSETFRNMVQGAMNAVKTAFMTAISAVVGFAQSIGGKLVAFWNENGTMIMQALSNIGSVIGAVFNGVILPIITVAMKIIGGVLKVAWAAIKFLVIDTWNSIKGAITGALNIIMGTIKIFSALLTGNWGALWSGLKQVVVGALQLIWNVLNLIFIGKILKLVRYFGGLLKLLFTSSWGSVKNIVVRIVGSIANHLKIVFNNILRSSTNIFKTLGTWLGTIWNGIKTGAVMGWGLIRNAIMVPIRAINISTRSIFNGIRTFLVWIWTVIKNSVVGLVRGLWGIIRGIWNVLSNVTRSIFGGLRNFFVAVWTAIKNRVVAQARLLWSIMRGVWNTLSKVSRAIFSNLRNFLIAVWNNLRSRVVAISRALWNIVRSIWNTLSKVSRSLFSSVRNFIVSVWNNLRNRVAAISRALWSIVRGIWNTLSKVSRSIFSNVRNYIIAVWNHLRNRVVAVSRALWNAMRNIWNSLSKVSRAIFSNVRNYLISVWNNLRSRVTSITRSLWNIVRGIWNSLSKVTRSIFNNLRNFLVSIWNTIRNKVSSIVRSLWSRISGTWNNLSKGTRNIFNKVGSFLTDKWKGIKDSVTGIVSGLWSSVKKTFTNMKNGIKGLAGKIGDTINNMVKGIKKGLNALIKGVNFVADKLGIDTKIPKLSTGTAGVSHTPTGVGAGVSNGAVSSSGFATLNDRGRGNGAGTSGRQELVQKADGRVFAPKGKDVTVPLSKGDRVINGRDTQRLQKAGAIPKFSRGIGSGIVSEKMLKDMKKKRKKHGDEEHGAMDAIGTKFGLGAGGLKDWAADRGDDLKKGAAKTVNAAGDAANSAKEGAKVAGKKVADLAGDLLDYVGNPGKLLDGVLKKFGVKFPKIKGQIPKDMMWDPMWKSLKQGTKTLFDGWLTEAEGAGDGGYVDLSKGINFGFAPTAAAAAAQGYPFPRPHMGLDINYKMGEKLYSTLAGTATGKDGYNGGFGKSMWIKSGNLQAIYGHMSKLAWTGNKKVKPGSYLGKVGSTGDSTGPHLHYEMRRNGKPFDPTKWLKENNGGGSGSGKWKGTVKKALKIAGLPTSGKYVNAWLKQIQTESGGDAKALGGTDGLADGRAKGLVQVKPGTFNAYKMKGYGNIWKGLDNLIAGMRYANAKYGNAGLGVIGKGHGYAKGTNAARAGLANVFEKGGEIMNLRGGEQIIPNDVSITALKQMMSSDLFARTQSAVYAGISQYADALRQQEAQNRKEQMRLQKQNSESSNDREMLNALMQMVAGQQEEISLLRQLVASSQNIESQPKGFTERDVSTAQGNRTRMSRFNKGI